MIDAIIDSQYLVCGVVRCVSQGSSERLDGRRHRDRDGGSFARCPSSLTHAQWYTYSYATQQGLTLHQHHNHLCLYLLGLELIRYEAATGLGGSRVTYTWPHLLL